jgi:hypothetical protein
MRIDDFQVYLARFENEVLIRGYERGLWGSVVPASTRRGSLAGEPIGRLVGDRFVYDRPLVLEYGGHIKKSTGFMALAVQIDEFGIRTLRAPLVNFSSCKVEHVYTLAPELVEGFVPFKREIIIARWGPQAQGL